MYSEMLIFFKTFFSPLILYYDSAGYDKKINNKIDLLAFHVLLRAGMKKKIYALQGQEISDICPFDREKFSLSHYF
jgi:CRISPR/Cas system endoribonuclease Cas6 (RAMP superfamily)